MHAYGIGHGHGRADIGAAVPKGLEGVINVRKTWFGPESDLAFGQRSVRPRDEVVVGRPKIASGNAASANCEIVVN